MEITIQWVLYERFKRLTASTQGEGGFQEWAGMQASARTAKCIASLITYLHDSHNVSGLSKNSEVWCTSVTTILLISPEMLAWSFHIRSPLHPCNSVEFLQLTLCSK